MSEDLNQITDVELNAFLDNQLGENEKSRVLHAINADRALQQRLSELRQLRDMFQHAYEQPPRRQIPVEQSSVRLLPSSRMFAIAASLLMAIGALLGWISHKEFMSHDIASTKSTEMLNKVNKDDIQSNIKNVILHITSGDSDRLEAALDDAENLLSTYKQNNQFLQLEIIANDTGLNLMRTDVSQYQHRISKLVNEYNNVRFLACSRAIKRLESQGINVELLPEIQVAPSALEQIIMRMQDGWQYIKA
jgi:intracellular sulfur oxidation DsrE/DsrF family protein